MTRYVAHLTLMTGHLRMSPRDEVQAEAIAIGRELIEKAFADGSAPLPPAFAGYAITAERVGRGLIVTVVYEGGAEPELISAFGVATRPRDAVRLWPMLAGYLDVTMPGQAMPAKPPAPWCAVVPLAGLMQHTDAVTWLGDFQRVIAWAWLETVQ